MGRKKAKKRSAVEKALLKKSALPKKRGRPPGKVTAIKAAKRLAKAPKRKKKTPRDELAGFVLVKNGAIMSEDVAGVIAFDQASGFVDVKIFPSMSEAASFIAKEKEREVLADDGKALSDWADVTVLPVKAVFAYSYKVEYSKKRFRLIDLITAKSDPALMSKAQAFKGARETIKGELWSIADDYKSSLADIRAAKKAVARNFAVSDRLGKDVKAGQEHLEDFKRFCSRH